MGVYAMAKQKLDSVENPGKPGNAGKRMEDFKAKAETLILFANSGGSNVNGTRFSESLRLPKDKVSSNPAISPDETYSLSPDIIDALVDELVLQGRDESRILKAIPPRAKTPELARDVHSALTKHYNICKRGIKLLKAMGFPESSLPTIGGSTKAASQMDTSPLDAKAMLARFDN
jgi:hypothetical protein